MSNVLMINATPQESRVCVLEDGQITDYYLERRHERGQVGNVYLGRVIRVLPGMQAAFVDIGLEKAAFIHASDVVSEHSLPEDVADDAKPKSGGRRGNGRRGASAPIEKLLQNGQTILVQVTKDPINQKGARITSHISLAGRYLVFMPTVDHLGISRQISSDKERKRLRKIANEMRPKGGGFIVRTASQGVPSEYLRQDMQVLLNVWAQVLKRAEKVKAPKMLHEDLDLVLRAARDLATADLDYLILDSKREYDRVLDFIDRVMPGFDGHVQLYVGTDPIFDAYGVEPELEGALNARVDLPSGGYLIIERTEALTAIDVNTGRFVGKGGKGASLEETITQTNVEAAEALAYQLRLRNIGGLIIVDFIDMDHAKNREKVQAALTDALSSDRGNVKFTRISEFGLVEMTRKRTRESLQQMVGHACPVCEGSGWVKSKETLAYELLRSLRRQLGQMEQFEIKVRAHPDVVRVLSGSERRSVRRLEDRFKKKLFLKGDPTVAPDFVDIVEVSRKRS